MTALYQRRRGDDRLAPACEWETEDGDVLEGSLCGFLLQVIVGLIFLAAVLWGPGILEALL